MERRQLCPSLVEEARQFGPHGVSVYRLLNGQEISWSDQLGNQQGQAWECSLRLCKALELRATKIRGARVIELVSLCVVISD
jgi:hypothetical protein